MATSRESSAALLNALAAPAPTARVVAGPAPSRVPAKSDRKLPPILEKAAKFNKADELIAAGLYPYFRTIESAQDTEVVIDGKKMLMLGSNSYMGLTNDPRIKEAINRAVAVYGSGCAGSRFLNGTLDLHIRLEHELADFMGTESALAFTTGYQANVGAISALIGKDDHVFIDRSDHASIIDGCRLGFGKLLKFRHNDFENLERLIKHNDVAGKLIIVDGVYSMEGDIVDLPALVAVAQKHGAAIIVDDAHGVGVLGQHGEGTVGHFGMTDDVDMIIGTFSKSLASIGGFVCGSHQLMSYLKHHARALIFSASMAPACAAAALMAMEIIRNEPERREQLWANTHQLLNGLKSMGFHTGASQTPIIPVLVGDLIHCFTFWRALHDAGIFVNPVVPPAVPAGQCLMRLSVMATHTPEQITRALEVIERIARQTGVLQAATGR